MCCWSLCSAGSLFLHLLSHVSNGPGTFPLAYPPKQGQRQTPSPRPCPSSLLPVFPTSGSAALPFCPLLRPGVVLFLAFSHTHNQSVNTSLGSASRAPPSVQELHRTHGPDSCRTLTAAAHSQPCPVLCSQQPVTPSQLTSAQAAPPLNPAVLHRTPGLTPPRPWPQAPPALCPHLAPPCPLAVV